MSTIGLSLFLGLCGSVLWGAEPGGEHELSPPREGLLFWIDAQAQAKLRPEHNFAPPFPGSKLGVVFDSSEQGRHFIQRSADSQPVWVVAGNAAAFRFDGIDDCLEHVSSAGPLHEFTLYLLARPESNPGGFRALFAANELGQRDYTTGVNVDMSYLGTSQFETLNIEGRGFGGAINLMKDPQPFGQFYRIETVASRDAVALSIDGITQLTRPRADGPIGTDQFTIGARFYTNEPTPASLRGFFPGDIAEVFLYDRLLTPSEREQVDRYLAHRQHDLNSGDSKAGRLLNPISSPPEVQVFQPGFEVHRLPVELSNINNLRYREDGKLFAVAYNGDVLLLCDPDGDGLENHVETFFKNDGQIRSPVGVAVTPKGYPHGQGIFVASKGRLSLITDRDGDDRADDVRIVAEGWQELPHGVDALGVELGPDGSVYFGLGTTNFTNAYLVDAQGSAGYRLDSERGTILRVFPDLKQREIYCTGIRFPVGLAFNRQGDLFATDQEGATWLANGNPFDELLHIRRGKHYGFPPRHPDYLPDVIDEPSVFDYIPQHQSTCGLCFNEPTNGGKAFGPADWLGDAIVCGYSRGKLYRTSLKKTPVGYVARTTQLAQFQSLLVDACVSPVGDLVLATHSGAPDWGSGPNGRGELYRIRYIDTEQPQPVLAYPRGPGELCIAFDKALDPAELTNLTRRVQIMFGKFAGAGDEFETFRPGYAVVEQQMRSLRYPLDVYSAAITPDRRNLLLATAAQTADAQYALTVELSKTDPSDAANAIEQRPRIDLAYDLSGLDCQWMDTSGAIQWCGWLPHADLAVSKHFTRGSSEHERLWQRLEESGTFELRTRLRLDHLLRPKVQPGSTLDYTLPAEQATVTISAARPFELLIDDQKITAQQEGSGYRAHFEHPATQVELAIQLRTGPGTRLDVSYHTADDSTERPFHLHRFLLPWSRDFNDSTPTTDTELAKVDGDWHRGRKVFFSESASCSKCHTVMGQGGRIGPDLSNLIHRDRTSVLRDITNPSAAINPDYISYQIALTDGNILTGPVRTSGKMFHVGTSEGKETVIDASQIEVFQPANISIMPEDIEKKISPQDMNDLLAFLLTAPPEELQPAPIRREGAPPARSQEQVQQVLGKIQPPKGEQKPLHIALIIGPKDHGINEHDYPDFQKRWQALLGLADNVTVTAEEVWPSVETLQKADVLIWYSANPGWTAERGKDLDAFQARGGGMVYLHYAVNGQRAPEELAMRIGLAWKPGQSKFRHGALTLKFQSDHPIVQGLPDLELVDETYWQLTGEANRVRILATAVEDDKPQPILWAYERDKGRVFGCILGHYSWTFDDPLFRLALLRGICWSAGEPVDRLSELSTIGARIDNAATTQ